MAITLNRIVDNIKSSQPYKKVRKAANNAASSVGAHYEKSNFKDFFGKHLEPMGGNNKFLTLAGLMVFCIIIPRVRTALKRNPNDKEATMDEIKEILFRDVQSVLVVLFMLKTLNSLIASKASKVNGLPMTTKQYQKVFTDGAKTIKDKAKEFIQNPKEKLGIIKNNILDALHPTEGVRAKRNDEYVADFSNYSWEGLPKFFKRIKEETGGEEKAFNTLVEGTITKYENILNGNKKKGIKGVIDTAKASINKAGQSEAASAEERTNIEATVEQLKQLRGKGPEVLSDIKDKNVQNAITDYIKDKDNALVQKGTGTNAWLRSAALAMEASYLGFGIPALNQLRLERKYLKNNKHETTQKPTNKQADSSTINQNIKAQEVKLYHEIIR